MTTPERSVEEIVDDGIRILLAGYMETGWARLGLQFKLNELFQETLETERQKREEMVEKFEQFIDDIPEAYGWGKKDEEADRGYQVCSKSVKAEGVRLLQALTQPNNPK